MAISKRMRAASELVEAGHCYSIDEGIAVLQKFPKAKFNETVEVAINLGVDSRKSDQVVRGASVLPHGTGKTVRVAVFAQGDQAEAAKAAGADRVGFEDLAEAVKKNDIDFDVVIATPAAMRVVGQLGPILGPRGLMPNPKVGTVSSDVATAVKNAKGGQVRYRTDKAGILHSIIGKVDFKAEQLKENLKALLAEVNKLKPTTAKGIYLKKLSISTTMGPGVWVDVASIV